MTRVIDTEMVVREGNLIRVWNDKRPKFSNADKLYYSLWLDNGQSVDNEFAILLTEKQVNRGRERAESSSTIPKEFKVGRPYWVGDNCMIVIRDCDGVNSLVLTRSSFNEAYNRALKNLEDIPKKKFLVDLLD